MSCLVYLFRHGTAAPSGVLTGRADVPLLPEGIAQARRWRDALATLRFDAAWASPLERARETAAIILSGNADNPPLPGIVDGLQEISLGVWEGRNSAHVRQEYPELWAERGRDLARVAPPGGETFIALAERVLPVFADIFKRSAGHSAVLIAAHQAVNRVLLATLTGTPLDRLRDIPLPPAALALIELRSASLTDARVLRVYDSPEAAKGVAPHSANDTPPWTGTCGPIGSAQ